MWSNEEEEFLNKYKKSKGGAYYEFVRRMQQKAYLMGALMMDHSRNYHTLVYGLKVVELLQLTYLVINSRIAHIWNSDIVRYIQIFCGYLNWPLMRAADQEMALIAVTVANIMTILAWAVLLCLFVLVEKKEFIFRSILLRVLTAYSILYTSILVVPLSELTFQVMFCISSDLSEDGS